MTEEFQAQARGALGKRYLVSLILARAQLTTGEIVQEILSNTSFTLSFFFSMSASVLLSVLFRAPLVLIGTVLILGVFTTIAAGGVRSRQHRVAALTGRQSEARDGE